jgi:hypothetical protein
VSAASKDIGDGIEYFWSGVGDEDPPPNSPATNGMSPSAPPNIVDAADSRVLPIPPPLPLDALN